MGMTVLDNGRLRVCVSDVGAEMVSVRDAQGVERLWDGQAVWPHHAPVLFPVAGALKEDAYLLGGQRYTLGKHGFVRDKAFAREDAGAQEATFRLDSGMAFDAGFPFAYVFRVRYALSGDSVQVDFITENRDTRPFYFSAGAHEAYACPEGTGRYAVVFERAEPLAHSVLSGGLLTGEQIPIPAEGNVLPMTEALFSNDSVVLAGLASRAVTLTSTAHARTVRVAYADFDYLLLWTMPGAGFLCIEPWHNLPDSVHTCGNIEAKPGMIALAPGETRTLSHTVTFA